MTRWTCDWCGGWGMLDPLDAVPVERECPCCDGVGHVEVGEAVADEVRRRERAKVAALLDAAREMVERTANHDEDHLDWPLGWDEFCAALAALEE